MRKRKGIQMKGFFSVAAANICRYLFFLAFAFVLLYPFVFMIVNALKSYSDTYDPTVVWVPKALSVQSFKYAIKTFSVFESVKNTFVYEIIAGLIQFCSCAVAAYGLARFSFKGKKIFQAAMILSILVPSMMTITPSYVNFSQMDFLGILGFISKLVGRDLRPNILGTPLVFYLPSLTCVGIKGGLFIYIFNQFYKGLPSVLEEAAWIDGADPWRTFLSIVVPSSGSAAITVLLFSVVWHWNDYYLAQMFNSENPTFSVALNNFTESTVSSTLGLDMLSSQMLSVPILLAGCCLFILPLILFYLIMQKRFVASIATSGIVG